MIIIASRYASSKPKYTGMQTKTSKIKMHWDLNQLMLIRIALTSSKQRTATLEELFIYQSTV